MNEIASKMDEVSFKENYFKNAKVRDLFTDKVISLKKGGKGQTLKLDSPALRLTVLAEE